MYLIPISSHVPLYHYLVDSQRMEIESNNASTMRPNSDAGCTSCPIFYSGVQRITLNYCNARTPFPIRSDPFIKCSKWVGLCVFVRSKQIRFFNLTPKQIGLTPSLSLSPPPQMYINCRCPAASIIMYINTDVLCILYYMPLYYVIVLIIYDIML